MRRGRREGGCSSNECGVRLKPEDETPGRPPRAMARACARCSVSQGVHKICEIGSRSRHTLLRLGDAVSHCGISFPGAFGLRV